MTNFPKFWFEGNLWSNWVSSFEDIKELFKTYNGTESVDGILDKAHNCPDTETFGFKSEHYGKTTLRQFLTDNGVHAGVCGNISIESYCHAISHSHTNIHGDDDFGVPDDHEHLKVGVGHSHIHPVA